MQTWKAEGNEILTEREYGAQAGMIECACSCITHKQGRTGEVTSTVCIILIF